MENSNERQPGALSPWYSKTGHDRLTGLNSIVFLPVSVYNFQMDCLQERGRMS